MHKIIENYLRTNQVSQYELARIMDVSQSTIHGWLHKHWNVPFKKMPKLARVTGVSIEDLIKECIQ
jgi:transcriptional regulator with XRE-family HTH domain